MSKLRHLAELGQSIWLDYISHSLIASGDLRKLVEEGLRGVTSNPSIFEKAIARSTDYDDALLRLVRAGKSAEEIYESLAFADIRDAADTLRPVYERSDGVDGYVSLEVDPKLAHDGDGTVSEARRLVASLKLPNLMIKVPATEEGARAIRALTSEGINVNVTLIFSLTQYDAAAEAYMRGLEELDAKCGDLSAVASVASFFVSRIDSAVDPLLEDRGADSICGQTAIAYAKIGYARFREAFGGARWERLAGKGARVQRPLWASTSTKNPGYPDTLYVDSLIGPHTVNTVPPATLEAFRDHGTVALTVETSLDAAHSQIDRLGKLGISLEEVGAKLQEEGVAAFAESFSALLASIAEKREGALAAL